MDDWLPAAALPDVMLPNSKQQRQSTLNRSTKERTQPQAFKRAQQHAANKKPKQQQHGRMGKLAAAAQQQKKWVRKRWRDQGYLLEHGCRQEERLLGLGKTAAVAQSLEPGAARPFCGAHACKPANNRVCIGLLLGSRGPTVSTVYPYLVFWKFGKDGILQDPRITVSTHTRMPI